MELAQSHQFNRADYYRMLDVGILTEQSRVELIDGEILQMSPQKGKHALLVSRLTQTLSRIFDEGYHVRVQLPLALDNFNEPEPDLAVVRLDQYPDDEDEHPTTALLVIEVSKSSLPFDRIKKARLYARFAIPEYWIVDVKNRCLIVHRQPSAEGFADVQTLGAEESVSPLAAPSSRLELKLVFATNRPGA